MNIHLDDQESQEKLKQWWQRNGRSILVGIVIGIIGIVGVDLWRSHQQQHKEAASMLFDAALAGIDTGDNDLLTKNSSILQTEYDDTPYADAIALIMAKNLYQQGELTEAESLLRNVIATSEYDYLRALAQLRLGQHLIHHDQADKALKLFEKNPLPEDYHGIVRELIGDAHLSLGEPSKAVKAYDESLAAMLQVNAAYREILLLKRNNAQ